MLAVPWAVARKFGDDQAGGKAALVIGIAGTVYGSLGVGFAAQNAMKHGLEHPARPLAEPVGALCPHARVDRAARPHGGLLDRAGRLWAAEINVVLRYRLWPRSMIQPPLNRADRLVYEPLAQMQVRRPEQEITTSFTEAADEDPLASRR